MPYKYSPSRHLLRWVEVAGRVPSDLCVVEILPIPSSASLSRGGRECSLCPLLVSVARIHSQSLMHLHWVGVEWGVFCQSLVDLCAYKHSPVLHPLHSVEVERGWGGGGILSDIYGVQTFTRPSSSALASQIPMAYKHVPVLQRPIFSTRFKVLDIN